MLLYFIQKTNNAVIIQILLLEKKIIDFFDSNFPMKDSDLLTLIDNSDLIMINSFLNLTEISLR